MSIANNGFMATKSAMFSNMQGDVSIDYPNGESQMTKARIIAEGNIQAQAAAQGVPLDEIVTSVLEDNQVALMDFITYQGEQVVSDDPTSIAIQAVLLRAAQIAQVSKSLRISDYEALCDIESSESELLELNMPDASHVLQPDVQAAIKIALDHASDQGGGCSMQQVVDGLVSLGNYFCPPHSNFMDVLSDASDSSDITDFQNNAPTDITPSVDPDISAAIDQTNYPSPASVSIGGTLSTIPTDPTLAIASPAASIPSISTSASTLPAVNSSTVNGGVLNGLTSLFAGISTVAQSVTQAANSSAGAAGAIKNAISNVGANSIATYINNNKGTIILIVLIILAIIFAIVYAKHKK